MRAAGATSFVGAASGETTGKFVVCACAATIANTQKAADPDKKALIIIISLVANVVADARLFLGFFKPFLATGQGRVWDKTHNGFHG